MQHRKGKGRYRGFRATGETMRELARLDPSVGGGVATRGEGFLA